MAFLLGTLKLVSFTKGGVFGILLAFVILNLVIVVKNQVTPFADIFKTKLIIFEEVLFFVSFLSGSIFSVLKKNREKIWILLVLLVTILNFSYFKPEKFIQTTDEQLLTGEVWRKQIMRSIFDYLPIFAKEPPAEMATEKYKVLTGESKVYDFKKGTNWINFKTETKSHTIIRLSQYYFPDWKISVDGKDIKFDYKNNSLGFMTILLGTGNHTVDARLHDTPIRSVSNAITAVTFILTLLLFISQFAKMRKWIQYYRKRIN